MSERSWSKILNTFLYRVKTSEVHKDRKEAKSRAVRRSAVLEKGVM